MVEGFEGVKDENKRDIIYRQKRTEGIIDFFSVFALRAETSLPTVARCTQSTSFII